MAAVSPLTKGGNFFHPLAKGGGEMVTYADLFQYSIVLISLAGLILAFFNRKKK